MEIKHRAHPTISARGRKRFVIHHEKLYLAVHRYLTTRWFRYTVLFFIVGAKFFRVLCTLSPAIIQLLLFGLLRLYGRICVAHHSSSCPISSVSCLAFPFQVFVFVLWFDRFCGCHPFSHHLPVSGDHLCTFGGTGLHLNDF